MKLILSVLWSAKTTCHRLQGVFTRLEMTILGAVDRLDPHYADKRWASKWQRKHPVN